VRPFLAIRLQKEVIPLKKTVSFLLALVLLTGTLALAAPAASAAGTGSKAGVVSTKSSNLNVRAAASISSRIVSSLKSQSYVTLISKSGDWWYVRYGKNAYGYCSATYISEQSSSKAASVSVSSGSYLNVRSGAGINYAAKDKLYRGDQVVILTSYSNGFCKVLYNGKNIGYVSGNYLTASNAISLAVPLYRQFDTRWASITLGSTKKTMASIGCTTTSLAMTESFRTGTTITPAMMEARLSYTASGALYWPSNYVVGNPSDYLSTIAYLLKLGKPVIVGGKNAYGATHWVVVTGMTSTTVAARNFLIHDPGNEKRTTLADLIASYPTLMRIAYYTN
jgi:uncharacterized protein YgiM (DUF1202 family)